MGNAKSEKMLFIRQANKRRAIATHTGEELITRAPIQQADKRSTRQARHGLATSAVSQRDQHAPATRSVRISLNGAPFPRQLRRRRSSRTQVFSEERAKICHVPVSLLNLRRYQPVAEQNDRARVSNRKKRRARGLSKRDRYPLCELVACSMQSVQGSGDCTQFSRIGNRSVELFTLSLQVPSCFPCDRLNSATLLVQVAYSSTKARNVVPDRAIIGTLS